MLWLLSIGANAVSVGRNVSRHSRNETATLAPLLSNPIGTGHEKNLIITDLRVIG
jgi:hypothetical protein